MAAGLEGGWNWRAGPLPRSIVNVTLATRPPSPPPLPAPLDEVEPLEPEPPDAPEEPPDDPEPLADPLDASPPLEPPPFADCAEDDVPALLPHPASRRTSVGRQDRPRGARLHMVGQF